MSKLEQSHFQNQEFFNEIQNLRNSMAIAEKQVKQLQKSNTTLQNQSLNKSFYQNNLSHLNTFKNNENNTKPMSQSYIQGNNYMNNEDFSNNSYLYGSGKKGDYSSLIRNDPNSINEKNFETMRNLKNILNKIDTKITSQNRKIDLQ